MLLSSFFMTIQSLLTMANLGGGEASERLSDDTNATVSFLLDKIMVFA